MPKNLIIIESPGKIPAYKKYLGADYEIKASYGHVVDLPAKGGLAVDLKDNFKPTYQVIEGKENVVADIVDVAKKCDLVYLMSDPDREGTAIAWHLSKQFPKSVKFKRASTASITKQAILDALSNAGEIDMNMVDAYEARRILDRLCGFKTSFLVKQATGGISAGRVQSAALRILAEREKEIRAFVPEEYWPVTVELLTPAKQKVFAAVIVPEKMAINTEVRAKEVEIAIKGNPVIVDTYDVKQVSRNANSPFTTSSLQATASSLFGWDQKRTMDNAQKLYEGGHITYMRTDSTHIVPDQVQVIRSEIGTKFGKTYLPSKALQYKGGKNAQEAHEAIRPTHLEVDNASTGDQSKLYTLIWKRSMASQMSAEAREQVRATFKAGKQVVMAAAGSRQLFDGYKKCWDYRDAEDSFLPPMKVGDKCDVLSIDYEQKFTEPPSRYGVATFNSKLEDSGIARPSTLATVTKTLQDRAYIETKKNVHHVTDLGLRVVDFLVRSGFCFADTAFTKQMEDELDDILNAKTTKLKVLSNFWKRLKGELDSAKSSHSEENVTTYPCPFCAKNNIKNFLVKKFSKYGGFFSCQGYKTDKCPYKADLNADETPKEKLRCPECAKKGEERFVSRRVGRFGEFYSCDGYKEGCTFAADVGPDGELRPKAPRVPPKPSGYPCPNCGAELMQREGRYGPFLGCSKYPTCKTITQLDGTIKPKTGTGGFKKGWKKKG